ncbi:hypothetical protein [Chondromyces apiculatus]|uniref:Lipoprotein n=1 Tax=Chondromyces apiculatus DSM 436 TaxID=1192034 RepID=A0A017TF45_9BACT|nr:hypothetical protein [Chondromyces apiculatus]EYF07440.1 Hypothetical protein CAP_0193 [Chondromyces apiculatus DSM 436]
MRTIKLLLTSAGLLVTAGCSQGEGHTDACEGPCCDEACDPCANGACDDDLALGWEPPVLLWWGSSAEEAPACPVEAPQVFFEGFSGLSTRQSCPSCACGPSACEMPRVEAYNENMCNVYEVPDPEIIPFPLPEHWDGTCATADPVIAAGTYMSVHFSRTVATPCAAITGPEPMIAEHSWETRGRACHAPGDARHGGPVAEGFAACVWRPEEDAPACPEAYPERHAFSGGVEGALGCTPCACGEPLGAKCQALVRVHIAQGCAGDAPGMLTTLEHPQCTGWSGPSPITLGSLRATWQVNEPGTCTATGGQAVGALSEREAMTFCCARPG